MKNIIRLLVILILSCLIACGFAQQPVSKGIIDTRTDSLVQKFYTINHEPLYWFSTHKDVKRATEWLTTIEAAKDMGLVSEKLMTGQIRTAMLPKNIRNKATKAKTDRQITGLVLNFIKELQQVNVHFDYDEVSTPQQDSVFIYQLINSKGKGSVSQIVSQIDCQDHNYQVFKKFLADSISDKNSLKYKSIVLSMKYLKYISLYGQLDYIVANIPEAEVRYYKKIS